MEVTERVSIPEDQIRWFYDHFDFLSEDFPIPKDFKEFETKVADTRLILQILKGTDKGFFLNLSNNVTAYVRRNEHFVDPMSVLESAEYFYRQLGEKKIAVMLLERVARPAAAFLKQ